MCEYNAAISSPSCSIGSIRPVTNVCSYVWRTEPLLQAGKETEDVAPDNARRRCTSPARSAPPLRIRLRKVRPCEAHVVACIRKVELLVAEVEVRGAEALPDLLD